VPGAPSPWLDGWAPQQFVFGTGGASGPQRDVFADTGNTQTGGGQVNGQQTYDQMLHWKLAGTIILALATVFVLQQLGFRFVVAAGVG
jgi:hypothetical protein